jgi:predicted nucleotidyltransferase
VSQQELLRKVIRVLEDAGIEYMITGSIASSLQGEPRLTHDIDLVVAIQRPAADRLVRAFPSPDFYLDRDSVLDAIDRQGTFNMICVKEGGKVDFWMLKNEPFDQSRFSRKYVEEFMGIRMQVSSPEDTILAKLRCAKESGGSEKTFRLHFGISVS